MLWIPSYTTIGAHPKTRKLARALQVSIPTAVGHLHLLWHHAMLYASDGHLAHEAEDIALGAHWDSEPDVLTEALVATGWVDKTPDGFVLHEWGEYGGKVFAARQESREKGALGLHRRWHEKRGITDPGCAYCHSGGHGDANSGANGDASRGAHSGGHGDANSRLVNNRLENTTTDEDELKGALRAEGLSDQQVAHAFAELQNARARGRAIKDTEAWLRAVAKAAPTNGARPSPSNLVKGNERCPGCDECDDGYVYEDDGETLRKVCTNNASS